MVTSYVHCLCNCHHVQRSCAGVPEKEERVRQMFGKPCSRSRESEPGLDRRTPRSERTLSPQEPGQQLNYLNYLWACIFFYNFFCYNIMHNRYTYSMCQYNWSHLALIKQGVAIFNVSLQLESPCSNQARSGHIQCVITIGVTLF